MDEFFKTPQAELEQAVKELEPCWLILDTHATRAACWNGGNGIRREKCHRLKCSVCGTVREEPTGYFVHGAKTECRECHRIGEIVNPRLYTKESVRTQLQNAVMITVEAPESVWIECVTFCYDLIKNNGSPFTKINVFKCALFHFSPGKAEKWRWSYYNDSYVKANRPTGFGFYEGSFLSRLTEANCNYFGLKKLKETFLKYLSLEKKCFNCRKFTEVLVRYCKWPVWTEICLKTENTNALRDRMSSREVNRRGKNIDKVFSGLTKEKKKLLFSYLSGTRDFCSNDIVAIYSALKRSSAETFRKTTGLFGSCECIAAFEIISNTGLSPVRIKNYLEKQKAFISLYRDYIDECRKLGYPLDDESVLFPKDLRDKHAETSVLCRYSINAAGREKCIKRHETLVKMGLELTCGELTVRAPVDGTDIIAEGAKLSHCVGGYAKRHANGETTILFIRRKADPDTPYFTLEIDIKTGRVIQCYGYKNRSSYKTTPSVARICSELTKKIQELNKTDERQEKTA